MAWDNVWEKVFTTQNWGKYPAEDFIRFIARNFYHLDDRKAIKILEVGCGPGANVWFMAREGFSVYGIDGSKQAIDLARKRLDVECPGWPGELIVGDICKLPFDDCFFDAVVDNFAISCNSFNDSQLIYQEMSRVCKHNGKLFSMTFATGCWGDKTGQSVGHNSWLVGEGPMLGKGYTRFTDLDEIPALVKGFNITGVEKLIRTLENREHEIQDWIIVGEKKDCVLP
jgi:ubiquinone/menaquinone biosynthesis C-methylase UbiE